jgi:hypothetical protein
MSRSPAADDTPWRRPSDSILERRPYDWASSWKGTIWWKQFHRIKERFPLLRPRLYLPYAELQAIAVL